MKISENYANVLVRKGKAKVIGEYFYGGEKYIKLQRLDMDRIDSYWLAGWVGSTHKKDPEVID